ncbi:ATP-dependent Clp protease ATP-binding subunit clpA-like CD4B protein, chloroplastic [Hordeum vulgare]|nr:ATP-dependent Clp protease ATP-binding subunit clpA-like CD4B protein, chloroplastic [Hordeum vulgare]
MTTRSGLGGAGDVLLVIALAPHLILRLVELLVGDLQFRMELALPPAIMVDLASEAVGLEQHRPLCHIRVRYDCPVVIKILQWGCDELVPEEENVTRDDVVSSDHDVKAFDNEVWKNKMMKWAQKMRHNKCLEEEEDDDDENLT